MKISKFTHKLDLGDHIALWHSIRLNPVFLTKNTYNNLIENKEIGQDVIDELTRSKIILKSENEDEDVIKLIQSKIPTPAVSLCYFILSETCNLACKYCFLGNNSELRKKFSKSNMTKETAEKFIHFFAKQLKLSGIDFTKNKSQLIFFGGEPFMNYDVMIYVAKRVNELKNEISVLKSTQMTAITNGTLLTKKRILEMKELGITCNISVDGSSRKANANRVYPHGKEAYDKIISALDMCKELGIKPSLSVTLSEETIEDIDNLMELIKKYEIEGLGYNILLSSDKCQPTDEYYQKASQFIIDSFEIFRKTGVYEDRIMRKLKTFTSNSLYLSDCGATAGGQLIFTPDGKIGVCHGLLAEKEDFDTSLDDVKFNHTTHPTWNKWSHLVPVANPDCYSCEALAICGGGCPVNAREAHPERGLSCLDERQCVHSKKTLEYLIRDLYKKALNGC